MQYTGFIKRFLPFALTFAAGLLIASLFVPIGLGRLKGNHGEKCRHDRVERENEMLRDENLRLRTEIRERGLDVKVDSVEMVAPPPPVFDAPVAPRHHR